MVPFEKLEQIAGVEFVPELFHDEDIRTAFERAELPYLPKALRVAPVSDDLLPFSACERSDKASHSKAKSGQVGLLAPGAKLVHHLCGKDWNARCEQALPTVRSFKKQKKSHTKVSFDDVTGGDAGTGDPCAEHDIDCDNYYID